MTWRFTYGKAMRRMLHRLHPHGSSGEVYSTR